MSIYWPEGVDMRQANPTLQPHEVSPRDCAGRGGSFVTLVHRARSRRNQ